jgi:hypothetical protein
MTKIAPVFNQNVQRQDPAVFDYAREVEQVWRDFPETKDKVFFLDICAEQKLIYPEESEQKQKIQQHIDGNRYILSTIEEYNTVEKSSCCAPAFNDAKCLLLYTKKHAMDLITKTATAAQETAFVFDHELGHAIIPDAGYRGNRNMAECIADAYAVIRHFQRFGADSTAVDALVGGRSFLFAFKRNRASHFTSPVVEKILARRYDIAWDSLTPQQTTQLAWRFAMEYAMHPVLLDTVDRDLKKLQGKIGDIKNGDTDALEDLVWKVLSTNISDVFKCGAAALKFCLDGQMANIILQGEYWDNVRQRLAEKQKIFTAQAKLLFSLGAEDRPLQRTIPSNVIKFKP